MRTRGVLPESVRQVCSVHETAHFPNRFRPDGGLADTDSVVSMPKWQEIKQGHSESTK